MQSWNLRRRQSAGVVLPLLALLVLGLAGCAGYRGGWESLAYIGDAPPPAPPAGRTPYEANNRPPLRVPGLELRVSIDNQLRTHDTQVWLFALPVSIDPREVQTQVYSPGKTRVRLSVTALQPGFVFRPRLAVLGVAGNSFNGTAGFEFGKWLKPDWRRDDKGLWDHRPVGDELALSQTSPTHHLTIEFDTASPSPETPDIALDLSRALAAPGVSPVPPIRFLPVRWREGYT